MLVKRPVGVGRRVYRWVETSRCVLPADISTRFSVTRRRHRAPTAAQRPQMHNASLRSTVGTDPIGLVSSGGRVASAGARSKGDRDGCSDDGATCVGHVGGDRGRCRPERRRRRRHRRRPDGVAHDGRGPGHPQRSRRRYLDVNTALTRSIVELSPAESQAVLALLFAHVASPNHQVRWVWSTGDLVIWDERPTQHLAVADQYPQRREVARVNVIEH
jgi:hypothetical protein